MLTLTILHNDGEETEIFDFKESQIETLIDCISNNKMYWNPETQGGYWANASTIRRISAVPQFGTRKEDVSKAKEIMSKSNKKTEKDSGSN